MSSAEHVNYVKGGRGAILVLIFAVHGRISPGGGGQ